MTPAERINVRNAAMRAAIQHRNIGGGSDGQIAAAIEACIAACENAAAAAERIAAAPRAWAVKVDGQPMNGDDVFEDKLSADALQARHRNTRVVPVALVELKPEEV